MRSSTLVVGLALVLSMPTVAAQPPSAEMVVSLDWLSARLNDPAIVVISSDDGDDYVRGHIPGARSIGHMETMGGDHRLLEPVALAAALARGGARDDARIVLYGSSAMATGWLYMALASIGHGDHVSFLDGNLEAWRRRMLPVASTAPAPARGALTPRPAPDVVVDARWVRERLQSPAVKVLDVRTPREREKGFVPGSSLVLWQELFSDQELGTLKSRDEIRALLARAGVTGETQAVTYCAVGMRASLMYFAARYVGAPARVYVGSWQDWTSNNSNPIAR